MRLTMSDRKAVIKAWSSQYRKARKKEKGRILDELVALTGYNRWYVVGLLRWDGKVIRAGRRVRLVGDLRKKAKRTRHRLYDEAVLDAITREKLRSISASSIDRLLVAERRKWMLRGRSGTKPGTLLKHQIPIRTFADWNEKQAGFVEIDLVGHDGGDASGDYCQTLDVTDVASTWTETGAVINKAQVWVFDALKSIRVHLPFPLLGIDSDNGSEFINNHLLRYCRQEKITFTRGRSGRKNDGCFVEQKNYSVVRRAVGYARYDSAAQLRLLNELYGHLRLYTNYFQPVMKLKSKERNGAKVKKKYDEPKTPYQRLMAMPEISTEAKRRLKAEYATLNPAQLKREITRLQEKLFKTAASRRRARISTTIHKQANNENRAI